MGMRRRASSFSGITGAVLCALGVASTVSHFAIRANAREHLTVERASERAASTRVEAPAVVVAPPSAPAPLAPKPLRREVVFLHGMGERPEDGCESLRATVSDVGWLLCPRGNMGFGRGFTWGGGARQMASRVDDAEEELDARSPGAIDWSRKGVFIAFSQGAYVAMEVLSTRPNRYSSALFIGADVKPSKVALHSLGIGRVAFAAGRYDMTHDPMKRTAASLVAQGVDARFFDLGAVGHTYFSEDPATMAEVLAWLDGPVDRT